jgi:hypothetical protein
MLIRLNDKPVIDNLRHYPREIVDRLAMLLCEGAVADADPRRKGFYDVSDGGRSFFIHISPVTGHVWLLASWCAETTAPARYAPRLMPPVREMAHLY